MKVKSYKKPNQFEIIKNEDKAVVKLNSNILQIEVDESNEKQTVFEFDSYKISVNRRDSLEEDISENFDNWLQLAAKNEYDMLAEQVRQKRDKLLAETDKEMAFDRLNLGVFEKITATTLLNAVKSFFEALSEISNGNMAKYRQALRDIPQQEGFPYNVKFPVKPEVKKND